MNTEQKLVSVIVPVYNRESYLEECVASVLNQTYQDFEILLIDDGSTDGSLALCHGLRQRDSRVRVLETAHVGVSGARNLGLDAAQGEYVFFLDSDDVIHPGLIETLVSSMGRNGAVMAGCDVVSIAVGKWASIQEHLAHIERPVISGETEYQTNENALKAALTRRSPLSMIGGVMMRRDLIGETRFRKDLFIGEDGFFIYENLIKGADAEFLKQKWYYARHHSGNSTWNFGYDGFYSRFLRKKLTWESEELLGRQDNAKIQKASLMSDYFLYTENVKNTADDKKRIRRLLKQQRKVLVPSFSFGMKVWYYMSVYAPLIYNRKVLSRLAQPLRGKKK